MQTVNINNPAVKTAVQNFLYAVNMLDDGGNYANTNIDFLEMCFAEFLGSARFAELDGARRKDLFNQYQMLKITLDTLSDFTAKYPGGIDFENFSFTINAARVLAPLPRVPKAARAKIKAIMKPAKKQAAKPAKKRRA